MRVLIACPHLQRELPAFEPQFMALGIEIEAPPVTQQLSEQYLLANIERFDGVVAGDDPFSAAVIARATRLKVIAKWGIGVDNIDLTAAAARGIPVLNTPGQLSTEVADVAIGYMIMLARQLQRIDASIRSGTWAQIRGTSLAGKQLGIIGLGGIGKAVAKRAVAHDMAVVGFDPYVRDISGLGPHGVSLASLEELLETSDFISLHCSLTPETHHLLSQEQFARIKRGAFLINTSRGPLIDEPCLVEALESGGIAAAALDVFEVEPLQPDNPLRRFEQCVFGSHNSSNTQEAIDRINQLAVDNLLGVLLKGRQWAA